MRYYLITLLLISAVHFTSAQIYKPFRVELGTSFNAMVGNEARNGMAVYLEPRYAVNDLFVLGLRLERGSLSGESVTVGLSGVDVNSNRLGSNTFFGEFFFSDEKVRPFIGVGFGVFSERIEGVSVGFSGVEINQVIESRSAYGFAPRVGVNIGHLRMLSTFNFIGKDISNYMGLSLGLEIGGGKRSK